MLLPVGFLLLGLSALHEVRDFEREHIPQEAGAVIGQALVKEKVVQLAVAASSHSAVTWLGGCGFGEW